MATWSEILKELGSVPNGYDLMRRHHIKLLSEYTQRNVIIYYSAFLHKQSSRANMGICDYDMNGFMSTVNKLDRSKGLDLILHTPGGEVAATEAIVSYLRTMFGNNIRAIVPHMAMSCGTMIACSCSEIIMGKHSSLGPIDPQFGGTPAHGLIEEFEQIKKEVLNKPETIVFWKEALSKYPPTLIGECKKIIKWSESIVADWMKSNMFENDTDKDARVAAILGVLAEHSKTLNHARHLRIDELKKLGLKVVPLESDSILQDKVLSVHHATSISLSQTNAVKIVENQLGCGFIQQCNS